MEHTGNNLAVLHRRILSLWFPRLEAERLARADPLLAGQTLVVIGDRRGTLRLTSLGAAAEAAGLRPGMTLADAATICPSLVTRPEMPSHTATFLGALARWAGRFSPWVVVAEDGLLLDVTGCARLFGGEAGLVAEAGAGAAGLGLTLRHGLADTVGAAWAVARFTEVSVTEGGGFAGDAIDQEARATRSRAERRGGQPVPARGATNREPMTFGRIVAPGDSFAALARLPVAALRIAPETIAGLQAVGLGRIGEAALVPRAQLSRRFGREVLRRLDQALGRAPEPLAAASAPPVLALRLTFPDPIGRTDDILAGLDRLLPTLCARLATAGLGARRVRLTLTRTSGGAVVREAGLARPVNRPERIRPLLALQLDTVDAGFGIDRMRLEATETEVLPAPRQGRRSAAGRDETEAEGEAGLAELVGRLGARLGVEAVVRLHPAESHIPEKAATEMMAVFSPAGPCWPVPPTPRPLLLFPPEPLTSGDAAVPPRAFTWRRQAWRTTVAFGPERIAAEWWLDDPAWRSSPRDYWRVETGDGTRLWLYIARGTPAGWFVQGIFA